MANPNMSLLMAMAQVMGPVCEQVVSLADVPLACWWMMLT